MIESREVLISKIRDAIYKSYEEESALHYVIIYCDGIGGPTFKVTIQKFENDPYEEE